MGESKLDLQQNQNVDPPQLNNNDTADDYDPHLHRNLPNATSNFQTLVHLLKGTLGTGIMAMPYAFSKAGYVFGVISTVLVTLITTHCYLMVIKNQYILCKRHRLPMVSYPMSMKIALNDGPTFLRWLSKVAVPFVDEFVILNQVGVCCLYVIFVAENIGKILVDALDIHWNVKIYIAMLVVPLMLLMCIRNLKRLSPFSLVSNILTLLGVGMVFYYFFRDGIPGTDNRIPFNAITNFPLYFGTILFSLNSIGVVIPVENNMKTPKSFNTIITTAMVAICLLYTVFGLFGYLRYGDNSKGSVTLNVDHTEIPAKCICVIFALATFISYALQGYVPISIFGRTCLKKALGNSPKKIYYEFVVRMLYVLITCAVAAAIPFIGSFTCLLGALCISVLGIIFPALMDICVFHKCKPSNLMLAKNILLILIGTGSLVLGTYTSIRDIISSYNQ